MEGFIVQVGFLTVPPHFQYQSENFYSHQGAFAMNLSWKGRSCWLQLIFHFGTENRKKQLKPTPCRLIKIMPWSSWTDIAISISEKCEIEKTYHCDHFDIALMSLRPFQGEEPKHPFLQDGKQPTSHWYLLPPLYARSRSHSWCFRGTF